VVEDGMSDLALLVLRVVTGGLLAGHGVQKLFGSFGGAGLDGTAARMESLGLRPAMLWAGGAGVGELVGGLLTVLGLGGPIGSILTGTSMKMATFKEHSGKPIWASAGGAELPVINAAVGTALILTGPGRYSLDRLFGIRVPRWLTVLVTLGAGITLVAGLLMEPEPEPDPVAEQAATARVA
jgi:putative oxidoreductase